MLREGKEEIARWEEEGRYAFKTVLTIGDSTPKTLIGGFYKLWMLTPGFHLGVARSSQGYKNKSADYSEVIHKELLYPVH